MPLPKYLDPGRYARYLRRRWCIATYDLAAIQADERRKFADTGFDVDAGRSLLDEVLLDISGKRFDHLAGTDSVHWLLFACLSLTDRGRGIRDILEIGTFRGKTSLILKTLFPQAEVVTCDLPEDDPILRTSYFRDDPVVMREYKARRDANVNRPGIRFVARNSFFLPEAAPGPYDLIWIDGGHHYPEIAWDMCNAYHMCRPGGIMMCDDVITDPRGCDALYTSTATEEVIRYIQSRASLSMLYFLKRENPLWSADPIHRKFIAFLRKNG